MNLLIFKICFILYFNIFFNVYSKIMYLNKYFKI